MIGISSCLAGCKCTYKGSDNLIDEAKQLVDDGKAVLICPEVLGGLTIPRYPCEIIDGKVINNQGEDKTKEYLLAQISVNYLKICSKQDKAKAQVQKTLDFLDDLPNISEIALYKMYGICCQSTNHKKDYENILKESGYERYFK